MMAKRTEYSTPAGSIRGQSSGSSRAKDSGGPTPSCLDQSEDPSPRKLRTKKKHFFGTLNVNTLLKVGKQKELTKVLDEYKIKLLAVQETRFISDEVSAIGNYRILKGRPAIKVKKSEKTKNQMLILGTAFFVHNSITESIVDFRSPSPRLSILTLTSGNKFYTIFNAHAPINEDNRKNPEKVEEFWSQLEEELFKTPEKHIKILMGDFNAQIGKEKKFRNIVGAYTAHKRTNRNGERLIDVCESFSMKIMSTQFKRAPKRMMTWRSPNSMLGEFQIDHVATTSPKEIMNVRVQKGANFDSDHYLTRIKVKPTPCNRRKKHLRIQKYRIEELKVSEEIVVKYQKELNTLDSYEWDKMARKIQEAAKQTIFLAKKKKHPWWNDECEDALRRRSEAWNKWNSNKQNFEEFKIQRKRTAKVFKNAKRRFERDQLSEIEENFKKNNTRNFYQIFKTKLRGYSSPNICFKNDQGKLIINDKQNCEHVAKYFKELLNCDPPQEKLTFQKPESTLHQSTPPNKKEIKEIIKSLKNNKASGKDSIVAELLKYAGDKFLDQLETLFQRIWSTEEIPEEWSEAIIHPLHKKGDKMNVNNYRGISLLPVAYKILSIALRHRIEEHVDKQLGEYQAGFRKGRSCAEQIFTIKTLIKTKMLAADKKVIMTFVDFKKAYDSIDRDTVIEVLKEFGVDDKTTTLIHQTLKNTRSQVKFLGELSEPFEIKTGLRQGDGLSPILFNCVLEKVIREWRKEMSKFNFPNGIRLGHKRTGITFECLAFADDIVFFAENLQIATKQIEVLKETAGKTGLQISFEKTEYMNIKTADPIWTMRTKYGDIKRARKFKYLGEILTPNMNEKAAIEERARKMETAFRLCQNTYKSKSLSYQAKFKHYSTVVKPECLYAAETIATKGLSDLEKKERRFLRKILGPKKSTDKFTFRMRPNKELYQRFENITTTIKKRRLTFYGHIKRMGSERLTNRILTFQENRKTQVPWVKEVHRDLEKCGITADDIRNRKIFRQIVAEVKDLADEKTKKNRVFSAEERERASQRMKEYWRKRKEKENLRKQWKLCNRSP